MSTMAQDDRRVPVRRSVEHPSVADRVDLGRSARGRVPRSSLADIGAEGGRPDPIALLERQAETRVPELVPIRYGRMTQSPFTFYRGAALVMASDLSATPNTGLRVQLCGDAHLSNFGAFGTPERRLVFDINDFDETLPGPFEWDVKRLAASLEVAGRDRGFTPDERGTVVRAGVESYCSAMTAFAAMGNLEVFYARLDIDEALAAFQASVPKKLVRRADKAVAKARTKDSHQALSKLTRRVDGESRIVADPPLIVPLRDLAPAERVDEFMGWVRSQMRVYRRTLAVDRRQLLERYRLVDLARKVVGVGSVGSRAYIALLVGRDGQDPLFLQFKEAQPSVLEEFAGRSDYRNAGHRVVSGQRLMQAAGDIFLGWLKVTDGPDPGEHHYYVRQLRDWKGSAELEAMVPRGMAIYAGMCGWTLARAHARSGDAVAIAAYLGKGDAFARALSEYARAYAERNERDHARLERAIGEGRIEALTGI